MCTCICRSAKSKIEGMCQMAKIKTEATIHMYLYPDRLTIKILLSKYFHLITIANINEVLSGIMFLFLDIFLIFLLLCDADNGSDKKTRFLRIISPSITDIAPNKKKNKCSSIICPARETSVDSNIDG